MFLTSRFFYLLSFIALLSAMGYQFSFLYILAWGLLALLALLTTVDSFMAFFMLQGKGQRIVAERLCNGEDNEVKLIFINISRWKMRVRLVDEYPTEIEADGLAHGYVKIPSTLRLEQTYNLHPYRRGSYRFGRLLAFVQTPLALWERRLVLAEGCEVKVYPDFLCLKEKEMRYRLRQDLVYGKKNVRSICNRTEFEEIREYVSGDDFRTINWNATARRTTLMINHYEDERSQVIYNVIDHGRQMQRTIRAMTLIDYAVNAALQLSFSAIDNSDLAGLLTFGHGQPHYLPPRRDAKQMQHLLEQLYRLQSVYAESDFSQLATTLITRASHHGLVVLYTDFDTLDALSRRLPHLRRIARRHALLVVFFEDEQLAAAAAPSMKLASPRKSIERFFCSTADVAAPYILHSLAADLVQQKHIMIDTLRRNGIHGLLTSPRHLTGNVIRKYFELKSQGVW